jgi:Rad3-related DNA helicase
MIDIASEALAADETMPVLDTPQDALKEALSRFCRIMERALAEQPDLALSDDILDVYFESLTFERALLRNRSEDVLLVKRTARDLEVKLFSLDPSERLRAAREEMSARAVFFSATLSPLDYFSKMLGAQDARGERWPPLFPESNCLVAVVDHISTLYKHRAHTADEVARVIQTAAVAKKGNYIVYFSSYEYLHIVAEKLESIASNIRIIRQKQRQTEKQKQWFLRRFEKSSTRSLVGLCVLGGLFSEGIDLKGSHLIGAIVVGPGLPKISIERNLIRRHFDGTCASGFDFAYRYPGMNKVVQAAGRVIRTERDLGVVLFIGKRFNDPGNFSLLYERWPHIARIGDRQTLGEKLSDFWTRHDRNPIE